MISYPKEKINVLLLENVHQDAFQLFQNDGFNVRLLPQALSEEELLKEIENVHVLGIRSKTNITPPVLNKAKRLMTIGCFCIGTNQVNLIEAEKKGVPVFNAPYSNTRSVAELVIAEIVMLARRVPDHIRNTHGGIWNKISKNCFEVRGKTLGIVGYGHIGSQVSVLAEAMGLKVIYYDVQTVLPLGNASPVGSYEELLAKADFLTFHVPETPETMNLYGKKEIALSKKGAYVINLSRGKVLDLEALAEGIKAGHIAGAGIDVFPEEPESNNDPFITPIQNLQNVILTPHIGGSTEEAQKNIGSEVANKLIKFINNGSTTFAVNFPNLELTPIPQGMYRILNVHKNQPGFLKDINSLVSEIGANISSQHLGTSAEIGYLSMVINMSVGDELKERIEKHPGSIKTRILY
ncbi:phosphoglycerate dehydrogenase [Leptospira wolffii]|uniref:D-3-phosphoglycerate dehydrogenase n=1 Tax=Leptospira wolffii TaxID=409998 RepID=A0A2M9Z8M9_9LEPT|nr:phosphoglycerate dehydrogenase [Leptospira wolffii]EPG67280.1 4-phosphoerythronate dehydrogenase [Leptospira wolffii serovar Khorat str. Khorat-H2]PJZ64781.1 D-3-phosphoglycerate dehydrogenase [Leptospira wolffii]TGK56922.1 phosphoglycerate dehydrogenase [Leptospira wolffii]TGK70956.1 phosphoglycerate dehydrogenase [Leptospira wolffii]TGK75647.1 phosphoglycerate dehydrogenase [Leptospira wolffii]